MSLAAKKQSRGSNAPVFLTKTVDRLPPSHEWLMNRATLPTLVASMFILRHAFPDLLVLSIPITNFKNEFSCIVYNRTNHGWMKHQIYCFLHWQMCIFLLPPSAVIPLHNHPGMTVFSKLLLGTMHIKAYDWADPTESNDPKPSSYLRLARLEVDRTFTAPCDASILYPSSGGNMHAFTAVTPCAVLDVLGPPYSKEDDRDCTYYRDFPCSHILDGAAAEAKDVGNSYGLLEEIEMPKELRLEYLEYRGPRVVESCTF